MRILHLLHQFMPQHVGGVELYTHWLASAQVQQGHAVTLFHRRSAAGTGLQHDQQEGVNIWAAWQGEFTPTRRFMQTFYAPALRSQFRQVLDSARPDIVHIQHLMGLPLALISELQAHRLPFVVTLWDFWWVCANAQLVTNDSGKLCAGPRAYLNCVRCALARAGQPQFAPAFPLLALPLAARARSLRQVLSAATRVIAPAEFVRNWYAAHGLPADNMIVVPPGLPYPPELRHRRQALVAENEKRPLRFGYIGGIAPQKGVHILLQAFRDLPGTWPQIELHIAGDMNVDPVYSEQLRNLADSRVNFLGRLDRQTIWQMLQQIDLLVVPSIWYETFTFVISEAFAAGVPVLTTRLGVMAERVRHEVDGLLVVPDDAVALRAAMQRFCQEPALRQKLRQGVRPPLTMRTHANEITVVYHQVTGKELT